MIKQLKKTASIIAMATALVASSQVFAQVNATPSAAREDSMVDQFWSPRMMSRMDKNKDGMVSRQEYMDYMGAQYDRMDGKKKGMLNKAEWMDKKMMSNTFPNAGMED